MVQGCINCCNNVYQIPTRVLCFLLVIIQGGILDYYLVVHKGIYWYGWVAADVALGLVFIMTFIISYRHLIRRTRGTVILEQAGSLPLGYFAWFLYSIFLGARVFVIYKDFASKLQENDIFGPNVLKINVSGAGFVFLLILLTHHNALPGSTRKAYVDKLTATVVFDILDSVDVLDIFFDESSKEIHFALKLSILIIACLNLLIPTLPLMTLSRTHFGHKSLTHSLSVLHKLCLVFLVNLPLFIIRMLLWHILDKDISIFPMKNVIMTFIVFHDLYDERRICRKPPKPSQHQADGTRMEELEDKAMFNVENEK